MIKAPQLKQTPKKLSESQMKIQQYADKLKTSLEIEGDQAIFLDRIVRERLYLASPDNIAKLSISKEETHLLEPI